MKYPDNTISLWPLKSLICLNHVINPDIYVNNWNRLQNAAGLGCFLSMWRLRMYATYIFTTCANFTKCEILVSKYVTFRIVPIIHALWRIGTNSSQCEICEMWNLRFNKAHIPCFEYHVWHSFRMSETWILNRQIIYQQHVLISTHSENHLPCFVMAH